MRRRRFLQGSGVVVATIVAGCSGSEDDPESSPTETSTPTEAHTDTATDTGTSEEETTTDEEAQEDDPEVDRLDNYRWDMNPYVNTDLRNRLDQYVERDRGTLINQHPAFEYNTDGGQDDHGIDFEGMKMYRDSNFDLMSQNPGTGPMEQVVNAFVDDSLYQNAKTGDFIRNDTEAPGSFSTEEWRNADTLEDSLDLGHNLIVSIAYLEGNFPIEQQAPVIREAYKRHHDFDVLAWSVPMQGGSLGSGMMYSPDDDKVRTFNVGGSWSGDGEAQIHTEIQNWRVFNNPENVQAGGNPTDLHHPLLFHTDEWDRGFVGGGFEDAKRWNADMLTGIASEEHNQHQEYSEGIFDNPNFAMTTGLQEKATRTMLEYNNTEETDFQDLWDLANLTVMLEDYHGDSNFVLDTGVQNDDYSGMFNGNIAIYEIEDGAVLDEVWEDQTGEYDNFGQVYNELEAV